jgi:hypothetical protein
MSSPEHSAISVPQPPERNVLIFSEQQGSRFIYTCQLLFRDVCKLEFETTLDRNEFHQHRGPRINYSYSRIAENEVHILPQGLLWERGIRTLEPGMQATGSFPALFPTDDGELGFDLLSAAFFLASRYEEYLPGQPDSFGRYDFRRSTAFRHGFLERPLINEWMRALRSMLRRRNPGVFIPEPVFRFIPTYDIDIAFAYHGRDFYRSLGGLTRDLLNGKITEMRNRISVLLGLERDPYDIYEWLDATHLRFRLSPVYFFLVAQKPGHADKNTNRDDPQFQGLVRYHASGYQTGLHPSWQSGEDSELLAAEKQFMEVMIGRDLTNSRQHYIRMQMPQTYRELLALGLKDEYSMGYGAANGFRASLASPYQWYDLEQEIPTTLRIHPFCFMDATARYAEDRSASEAYLQLKKFHDAVKTTGGSLYTIFHNNMLSENPACKSWREMYSLFLQEVVYWDL